MPNSLTGNEPATNGDPAVQAHAAIIQRLNRSIGDDYFPVESFENASEWDGVPIVFAAEHPDLEAFEKDPEAELKRIAEKTGKRADVVGTLAHTRIEKTGSPRLMSDLVYSDPEVFQLYESGKLSGSTGFWAHTDNGSLKGSVKPNHLLVFEEDKDNRPRDPGFAVLNKETNMKAFYNEGRVLSGKNQTRLNDIFASLKSFIEEIGGGQVQDEKPEPKTNAETIDPSAAIETQIEDVRKALGKTLGLQYPDGSVMGVWVKMTFPDSVIWGHPQSDKTFKSSYSVQNGQITFGPAVEVVKTYTEAPEQKTNMTETEIALKDAKIAELTAKLQKVTEEHDASVNKIREIEAATKDAEWIAHKNKHVPPGLVHTPELESGMRNLLDNDPLAYINKILELRDKSPKSEQGAAFVNKDDKDDPVAIARELRQSTGRVR